LDVAKNVIVVGVLPPDREVPEVDRIAHDEASVRRLVDRFDDRSRLRVCYEQPMRMIVKYRLVGGWAWLVGSAAAPSSWDCLGLMGSGRCGLGCRALVLRLYL